MLVLYLNNSKDRAEEKDGTENTTNVGEISVMPDNSYKTLSVKCSLYDSEGLHTARDLGEFSVNDEYIKCSLDIRDASNERQTNGALMVFIGEDAESIMAFCVPLNNIEKNIFNTINIYGVYK